MRIAQIAPLAESVPPKLYGGTERVAAWLIDELVGLGHEVTLFASGDSSTRGKLQAVWPRALRLGRPRSDPIAAMTALLESMAQRASEFDPCPHRLATSPATQPAGDSVSYHHAWPFGPTGPW